MFSFLCYLNFSYLWGGQCCWPSFGLSFSKIIWYLTLEYGVLAFTVLTFGVSAKAFIQGRGVFNILFKIDFWEPIWCTEPSFPAPLVVGTVGAFLYPLSYFKCWVSQYLSFHHSMSCHGVCRPPTYVIYKGPLWRFGICLLLILPQL